MWTALILFRHVRGSPSGVLFCQRPRLVCGGAFCHSPAPLVRLNLATPLSAVKTFFVWGRFFLSTSALALCPPHTQESSVGLVWGQPKKALNKKINKLRGTLNLALGLQHARVFPYRALWACAGAPARVCACSKAYAKTPENVALGRVDITSAIGTEWRFIC